MPVLFQGFSEYKSKYKWTPSFRSAHFSPKRDQSAPDAGLRSDQLGMQVTCEPSFTVKKKVWHRDPQIQNCLVWWPENSKNGEVSPKKQRSRSLDNGKKLQKRNDLTGDEPIQDSGLKQKQRSRSASRKMAPTPTGTASPRKKLDFHKQKENDQHRSGLQRATASSKNGKHEKDTSSSPTTEEKKSKFTQTPPKLKVRREVKPASSPKSNYRDSPDKGTSKTRVSPNKQKTSNIPLQRRAGMKSRKKRISSARQSEYQRNFIAPKFSVKPSPLLSALDVVHSSSPAIPPHEGIPFRSSTEYLSNYKTKESPLLSRSVPSVSPASPSMKFKVKDIQNPQKPFFAHAKHKHLTSEYTSQFAPNQEFQVEQLRKMAESNKQRHEGTHIDPHHSVQVVSNSNRLWEASSEGSSEKESVDEREDQPKEEEPEKDKKKISLVRETPKKESSLVSRSPPDSLDEEIDVDSLDIAKSESTTTGGSLARKLVWGEAEDGNEDAENPEKHTPSVISEGTEGTITEGRISTPRINSVGGLQRTHLDLTTPCTGGAILVSPPRTGKEESTGGYISSYSNTTDSQLSPHVAGAPTSDSHQLVQERPHPLVRSSPAKSPIAYDLKLSKNLSKSPKVSTERQAKTMTDGREKPDISVQRHIPSFSKTLRVPIRGSLRSEEFQHCGPTGRLPTPLSIIKGDNDDVLSVASSITSARASNLLQKARQRKDFWKTS